jgi:hypothetical protein
MNRRHKQVLQCGLIAALTFLAFHGTAHGQEGPEPAEKVPTMFARHFDGPVWLS